MRFLELVLLREAFDLPLERLCSGGEEVCRSAALDLAPKPIPPVGADVLGLEERHGPPFGGTVSEPADLRNIKVVDREEESPRAVDAERNVNAIGPPHEQVFHQGAGQGRNDHGVPLEAFVEPA